MTTIARHPRNPLAGQFPPVGAVYFSAYSRSVYRVLSQQAGPWGWDEITVQLLDHPRTDRQHSHRIGGQSS